MAAALNRGRPYRVTLFIRTPIITFGVEVCGGGDRGISFPETQRPFNIEQPDIGKLGRDLHECLPGSQYPRKVSCWIGLAVVGWGLTRFDPR